ncbi:MAG: Spy/CpxP family protein refolding chaperone [Leptospirillia bacterium]
MKKLLLFLGVFAVVGLLATSPAQAQWGGSEDGGAGGAGGMGEMMNALGLDDTQWAKFNELRRNYRKDTIQLQAKIDIAEVELEELADTSELNLKKISAKINEISKLEATMRIYRYQTLANMRSFISSEQFDTFRWMAMKMGFNFSEDGGNGHH